MSFFWGRVGKLFCQGVFNAVAAAPLGAIATRGHAGTGGNASSRFAMVVAARLFHRGRNQSRLAIGVLSVLLTLSAAAQSGDSKADTIIQLSETPVMSNVRRLGVNLGGPESYAASQYMKNIIPNPGFESGEYGMVFHTMVPANSTQVLQDFWDTAWNNDSLNIGQPIGFWDGADYEIVYGSAKGRRGTVTSFGHAFGRYLYNFDSAGAVPDQWSVVFVRQQFSNSFGTKTPASNADSSTKRPGSPGVQSLHATWPGADWMSVSSTYFDSYWRDSQFEAGKLMIIEGNWRIEFWAKGKNNGDQMRVRFNREGEGSFINRVVTLSNQWQKYTYDFSVAPGADKLGPYLATDYHPILVLNVNILTPNAEIWLDDMALYKSDHANPTEFTDRFVNLLKGLKPGVLRDWRTQFGASLDNELADQFARKVTGWRPHERKATYWGYSLHDFLELCQEVDAEPWYVIPPTFSPEELQNLSAYLCAPVSSGHPYALERAALGQNEPWTTVFSKIHLEYGNELWGAASGSDPFFGASLLGGKRLGQIAHDRFTILRSGPFFDDSKFDLIIGGQNGAPARQGEIMDESTAHDSIALAPYFGALGTWNTQEEIYYPLFARALATPLSKAYTSKQIVDAYGTDTEMSIYEINYHTTGGNIPSSIRDPFTAGASGALALPLYMMCFQRDLGMNLQCAFTASGFSFRDENGDYVRVWGMLRDIEGTRRKRPTWLGVEMVNKAMFGNLVETTHSGAIPTRTIGAINGLPEAQTFPVVNSFAYHDGFDHSVVLYNLDLTLSHSIVLQHARTPQSVATMYQFAPGDINATNEDAQLLDYTTAAITDFGNPYAMTLPSKSLTVLTWSTKSGITAAPPTLVFPDTEVSLTTTSNMTVTNEATTSGPRDITGITAVAGDPSVFQLLTALPINGVAPGSSVQFQWRFSPTANGSKSATYEIATTDPDNPIVTIQLVGNGVGDDDGDGVPASLDAFPNNPFDWNDTDGDGMGDNFEQMIIDAAQNDSDPTNDWIQTFDDVLPFDDFDNDGHENIQEFIFRTDPTDGVSLPVGGAAALTTVLTALGAAIIRKRRNTRPA
ncbi:MAG: choice-of-anchor D domain-containing protein [Candidatus Hydrogenedentes bacterium]|nr:choice-of-anchor D domain-containing protein [Candidatus Hydrogenedentota bacterium]